MRNTIYCMLATLALASPASAASNVGIDLNVHVGDRPPQVIVREPVPPPPPPPRRDVIVGDDIDFIYPDPLGFYVAVGVPYDLFYINSFYYMYRDGGWYKGRGHRGPWVETRRKHLPPGLRKHRMDRIRSYRDHEYVVYQQDRDHYRGRHFRPGKEEWKENHRESKEAWKDHRRDDKEQRKEEKRWEKEERQHDKGKHRGND